jgi:hypothetical protein
MIDGAKEMAKEIDREIMQKLLKQHPEYYRPAPEKVYYGNDERGDVRFSLEPFDYAFEYISKRAIYSFLDKWQEHACRGMKRGATAYHQGKIALITAIKDWIEGYEDIR